MSFQNIPNVAIKGIAATVPSFIENNRELELLGLPEEREKFISVTGIATRHTVKENKFCTSDLCFVAAEKLILDLKWNKEEIDCLLFVSQTPDYILPATACTLQHRLGLSMECFSMDISLGCSGYIYGLSTIGSLMSSGNFKKGLLLAGDTVTVTKSTRDKSTYPLFGDSGTATAIEYEEGAIGFKIHTGTDGKNFDSIMIPDGGFRNFFKPESLNYYEFEPGIFRNNLQSILNGPNVYTFGITKAPKSVKDLLANFKIEIESIDYFVFHQANLHMNEKIRTKLKIPEEKVPYSLNEYGNTSSASIPLTIVTRLKESLNQYNINHLILICGFGVGLSWGSVLFETKNLVCPEVILL